MILDKLYDLDPYSLGKAEKDAVMTKGLLELTKIHYNNCTEYRKILDKTGMAPDSAASPEEIPFLPVRLFKEYELVSVPRKEIVKTMTSSGTSGQAVSKIFLDRENVRRQTKTLSTILSSYIGKNRLPLLLLDTEMVKKDRSMFSARGAGIIGISTFGRDITYALDADMQIDMDKVTSFMKKHEDEQILMFGYTYMVWQFTVRALEKAGSALHIKNGILFHIGGWKKLKDQAVSPEEFNQRARSVLGNVKVHNYYGMAEQLGSVFVECEHGHMHCSNYSDVIIRRPEDFSPAGIGKKGLIELVSLLPVSYPGHALLTEDEGEILGIDDCPCGRKGKYFKIYGRIKGAEIRGCSDTYEKH